MAQTDAHDWDLGVLHQLGEMVDCLLAMGRIAGAVADEHAVEVVGHFVDRVVIREDGGGSATADEAAQDVLLDAAVDYGDVEVTAGADVEGGFGAHSLDEVDLLGVDEGLVLVGIVLFSDGDPGEGRSLLTKVGDNGSGIDA